MKTQPTIYIEVNSEDDKLLIDGPLWLLQKLLSLLTVADREARGLEPDAGLCGESSEEAQC